MSAAAAFAGGAGMVKIQTVEENRVPLQTLLPEAMLSCVFSEAENQKSLDWCDVVVIGPGLGVCGESRERAQWFSVPCQLCRQTDHFGCGCSEPYEFAS